MSSTQVETITTNERDLGSNVFSAVPEHLVNEPENEENIEKEVRLINPEGNLEESKSSFAVEPPPTQKEEPKPKEKNNEEAEIKEETHAESDSPRQPPQIERLLEEVTRLKHLGNDASVNEQNYTKALMHYETALNYLRVDPSKVSADAMAKIRDLNRSLLNNVVLCFIKQERWPDALALSRNLLVIDSKNMKVYYRMAKAQKELGQLDKAKETLRYGMQVCGEVSQEYRLLEKEVERALRENDKRDSGLYSRMMGNDDSQNQERNQVVFTRQFTRKRRTFLGYLLENQSLRYPVALTAGSAAGVLFYFAMGRGGAGFTAEQRRVFAMGVGCNVFALGCAKNLWLKFILAGILSACGMFALSHIVGKK